MRWKTKRDLISVVWTLLVTYAVSKWAFHFALIERGCEGAGSEYLVIPVAYFIAWKTINYLFDSLEGLARERRRKERRYKERCRRAAEMQYYR